MNEGIGLQEVDGFDPPSLGDEEDEEGRRFVDPYLLDDDDDSLCGSRDKSRSCSLSGCDFLGI